MTERYRPLDRVTAALVTNGNMPTWETQDLYENAWVEGIRPLDETSLKPNERIRKGRRRRHRSS